MATPLKSKKIYVNKYDEASLVIEHVMNATEEHIILSIPKSATFARSMNNFHALKREAEVLHKTLHIESVDDEVVDLAKRVGLVASNSFFNKTPGSFADIVPNQRKSTRSALAPPAQLGMRVVEERPMIETRAAEQVTDYSAPDGVKKRFSSWRLVFVVVSLGVAGTLTFSGLHNLREAEVRLVTQKKEFAYTGGIIVDRGTKIVDASNMKVPGQIFIERKTAALTVAATGKKQVTAYAKGNIVIYNAYSSEKQKLVSKTRFVTPDGKIVRLEETVTVPGAKIVDGKIQPSMVEAKVIADAPGKEYNIEPVQKLTIPGLKSTPKYAGFYGELKEGISGGYIGERAYPTESDIAAAKTEIEKKLEDAAKIAVLQKIPPEFKVAQENTQFRMMKVTVNNDVNEQGQFSVVGEGELSVMAFLEPDIMNILRTKASQNFGENYVMKSYELKYGLPKIDFGIGRMILPVDFKSLFTPKIKIDDLKNKMQSKSERDLKALLLSMPQLESATVSLWPFWVRSAPSNQDKISINLE